MTQQNDSTALVYLAAVKPNVVAHLKAKTVAVVRLCGHVFEPGGSRRSFTEGLSKIGKGHKINRYRAHGPRPTSMYLYDA
jgi:hypothetical protein